MFLIYAEVYRSPPAHLGQIYLNRFEAVVLFRFTAPIYRFTAAIKILLRHKGHIILKTGTPQGKSLSDCEQCWVWKTAFILQLFQPALHSRWH